MSDYIDDIFISVFCFLLIFVALTAKPFHYLFTGQKYIVKRTDYNGGLWWFYCWATHYALDKNADCPCCGVPKSKLLWGRNRDI